MADDFFGLSFHGAAGAQPPSMVPNDPEVERIIREARQRITQRDDEPPAPVLVDPYEGKGFGRQFVQALKDDLTGGVARRQQRYNADLDARQLQIAQRRNSIAARGADSEDQKDRLAADQHYQQQEALKRFTAMVENPNLPQSTRVWADAQLAGLKTDAMSRQEFQTEADVVQQGRREGLTGLVSADLKARGDVGQGTGQPSGLPVIDGLQPTPSSSGPMRGVTFGASAPKPMTPMTPMTTPMPNAGPAGPSSFSMTSPTPVGSIGHSALKIGADDLAGRPGVTFKTNEDIRQSKQSYHAPVSEPVYRVQTVDENGNPVVRFITRSEAAGHDDLAMPPTADMRQRRAAAAKVQPTLTALRELSKKIHINKGLMATAQGYAAKAAAKVNYDDDVAEYLAIVESFKPMIARALGHTGVLTEPDVVSAIAMIPPPTASDTLAERLNTRLMSLIMESNQAGIDEGRERKDGPPRQDAKPVLGPGEKLAADGKTVLIKNAKGQWVPK